jgi:hypothetical protein
MCTISKQCVFYFNKGIILLPQKMLFNICFKWLSHCSLIMRRAHMDNEQTATLNSHLVAVLSSRFSSILCAVVIWTWLSFQAVGHVKHQFLKFLMCKLLITVFLLRVLAMPVSHCKIKISLQIGVSISCLKKKIWVFLNVMLCLWINRSCHYKQCSAFTFRCKHPNKDLFCQHTTFQSI